ncbi:Adaptin N terminal region family protein [Tritrichomonas foetus]|uniref:Adaptin N terminal region family protein n=1 Tax=Tritrichomonas foetus TaxID=1144522 RepID=A0A1J4KEZ2_9EUKA|nr:Adaptin N terminal region family protein [Tritrichomonas foetus]|eukprot:OHT09747.1 Adaptin N terminal region family protein [Tritrichomonas foetus]
MATNRIQRDLTSVNTLLTSCVLTSLPPYLTSALASGIAHDVISLMTSTKPYIRQKAIMTFYHICLQYPDALKPGFQTLRAKLDDDDQSVVFAALTVISELCAHNPANFVPLIPTLHKMLTNSTSNWVTLRLISILKMLCQSEPRLPKKLITPFTSILDTTASITLLFECVRSIIEIPITNTVLLTYASQRMQTFLEHQDVNLRFLCLTLFIKLMQIQPKLVSQHKELITQCLDSNDEVTRMMALDLLAALANAKTIDGIVAKMFSHFKESKNQTFKNQIVTRIIEICSKADYALVSDFEWYINVLMEFIDEGGLPSYDLIADQFLDLALRVPVTRPLLVQEMAKIFLDQRYKGEAKLLLAASHIIGDYSEDSQQITKVVQPLIIQMNERVQTSCVSTAFKLYLKCQTQEEREQVEQLFDSKLDFLSTSQYAEVQDIASLTSNIVKILKEDESGQEAFEELSERLMPSDDTEEPEEILPPDELNEPVELFAQKNEDITGIDGVDHETENILEGITKGKSGRKKVKVNHPKQKQQNERVVILKTHSKILPTTDQPLETNKRGQAKPSALSNALASVDLTDTVAETEARANAPQTIPYDQSLQQKKRAQEAAARVKGQKGVIRRKKSTPDSASASSSNDTNTAAKEKKPTLRRRRTNPKAAAEASNETKQGSSPITGPVDGARAQPIGDNGMISVTAIEFSVNPSHPSHLSIELNVHNDTATAIPSINIELNPDDTIHPVGEVLPVSEVPSRGDTQFTLELDITDIIKPHIVKLRFIPSSAGADTLEASIRVFPSFFLVPDFESNLAASEEKATLESELDFTGSQIKPKELLQTIVNVTRGTIIATDDIHVRKVLSKTTEGHPIVVVLKADKESTVLTVKASEEILLQAIAREIKMKTQ